MMGWIDRIARDSSWKVKYRSILQAKTFKDARGVTSCMYECIHVSMYICVSDNIQKLLLKKRR